MSLNIFSVWHDSVKTQVYWRGWGISKASTASVYMVYWNAIEVLGIELFKRLSRMLSKLGGKPHSEKILGPRCVVKEILSRGMVFSTAITNSDCKKGLQNLFCSLIC